MATIFQEAETVILWLGPAASNSDQIISSMNGVKKLNVGGNFWVQHYFGQPSERKRLNFKQDFGDFLRREYWTRCWVVQEIAVASRIKAFCGNSSLDGGHMLHLWNIRSLLRSRQPQDLLSLLWELRACQTIEVLDRVYAILGLVYDQRAFVAEPDYTLTADELSLVMTKRFIKTTGSLDLLLIPATAGFRRSDSSPSWSGLLVQFSEWAKCLNVGSIVDYINGKVNRLRCGTLGHRWHTTNSSLVTKDSMRLQGQALSVVGLRIGELTGLCTLNDNEGDFLSSSKLLDVFDSFCRILMSHSHLYNDNSRMKSVVAHLDACTHESQLFLVRASIVQDTDPWLHFGSSFDPIIRDLIGIAKAIVTTEDIAKPSVEDLQHGCKVLLKLIEDDKFNNFHLAGPTCVTLDG
ncbi:hypothetical protein A1O3_09738 [Capronia epimyces CBS 606.96]|uniref:Heterokaryon incompatibility domain-containing protein n=1 Tax=Capronia epimyces CBS 606.96 TaxID=1182542 RepID=W9XKL4_9EURO|nr:uncharacterized protein A1O3_09738 [Capronia epimyces CBS 606.96]EXJ77511.1 hypothetical protein A1O3_09738 [Capronia epimyces CBS 606.96]